MNDIYVCPNHTGTGGYESCCACGGWTEGEEDYGKECTESTSPPHHWEKEEIT